MKTIIAMLTLALVLLFFDVLAGVWRTAAIMRLIAERKKTKGARGASAQDRRRLGGLQRFLEDWRAKKAAKEIESFEDD